MTSMRASSEKVAECNAVSDTREGDPWEGAKRLVTWKGFRS